MYGIVCSTLISGFKVEPSQKFAPGEVGIYLELFLEKSLTPRRSSKFFGMSRKALCQPGRLVVEV